MVGVLVGVAVGGAGVAVSVTVAVRVGVSLGVGVGVLVGVAVDLAVGVLLAVLVAVGVGVFACASVSLALLFAATGSVTPAGAVIEAELTRSPVADALIVATTEYVRLPPFGRLTLALMVPPPLAAGQPAPPAAAQVHVADVIAAGKVCTSVAPFASLGPAFDTTTEYVAVPPGL